jgi:hypothetical protein
MKRENGGPFSVGRHALGAGWGSVSLLRSFEPGKTGIRWRRASFFATYELSSTLVRRHFGARLDPPHACSLVGRQPVARVDPPHATAPVAMMAAATSTRAVRDKSLIGWDDAADHRQFRDRA